MLTVLGVILLVFALFLIVSVLMQHGKAKNISGAIAGLVGAFIGGAIDNTVSTTSASNMGFTAIMTAWLAAFNPLVMIASCLFITFLSKGMTQVRKDFKFTNDAISNIVIGIVCTLINRIPY